MYLTSTTLPTLLPLLPQDGVGAEIGVLNGDFSAVLLRECAPARLHLIDPWIEQGSDYRFDSSNAPQPQQDRRFEHVSQTFAAEIASRRVMLHREFSKQAAAQFPDKYFDWIYIDGDHTYEGVVTDLMAYAPKMKETGLILGDDFINTAYYLNMKFGVVEAVHDFVCANGYEFLLLTQDWRFVLSRPGNPIAAAFLQQFLATTGFAVEIAALEKRTYTTKIVPLPGGQPRFIHSFH